MQKVVLIVLWSICCVGMNLGAKKVSMGIGEGCSVGKIICQVLATPWFYLFTIFAVGTAVFYMWLLRFMPLSIAGPIVSALGVILIALTGAVFCRENIMEWRIIAGFALTLLGIVLLQSGTA